MAHSAIAVPLLGQQVSIAASTLRPDFSALLQRGLQASGAQLVSATAPGVIVLSVNGLDEDKTVSAYSSIRQVREFNHYIELSFTAQRQSATANQPITSANKVRAERTQIYDSRYVLGVSAEALTIRDELRAEAVRLLALKLSVL